ncbi:prenyltransferase/squalene oxidase repeat-containing protein [Rhodopirellula halodulae]|uniref:prenyltransferase/squalene oxidase repeat-containing protein n=1 Tax=Rhodopirellula halodulae TaxID=2894198 RepID=UPI001E5D739A|nr:prenyltransferase/squalene oxidase repeat-containing protein [Rhodopirellula sp. JC737]MCC9658058.1 squalene--hopene cyclase [Rhodopirellula sp. JC737]
MVAEETPGASVDQSELRRTLNRLREELLSQRTADGHWTGELSASALSTATAISAMSVAVRAGELSIDEEETLRKQIQSGRAWLAGQQNDDGGFGDTDRSHSNIATSYLVLAAWELSDQVMGEVTDPDAVSRLKAWIENAGELDGLRKRYGKDKTFVVPILTNMAIAGLVPWKSVSALPFEAAVVPQSLYRFLGLPVVSYAVPALVAIGQVKFLRGGGCLPPWSWVRRSAIESSMRVLLSMQPQSGGYLEATPLTAFVVMSLSASGRANHEVTRNGLRFLKNSMLPDGSWPIDTNLANWVTSLATTALAMDPDDDRSWSTPELIDWQRGCQYQERHPFTGADPGGWGWTDLTGSVPDADDTPGAIVSLRMQATFRSDPLSDDFAREWPTESGEGSVSQTAMETWQSCDRGVDWLLGLQNRDGGWPTFCRGWGKLPFDRSSNDLTAHALRAIACLPKRNSLGRERATQRGLAFLRKSQLPDGSWLPLWFGNQDRPDEDNPIYGTSRVLIDVDSNLGHDAISRGLAYLIQSQNGDGGWGGGESVRETFGLPQGCISSVEETALALETLACWWARIHDSLPGENAASPGGADSSSDILDGSPWDASMRSSLRAAILAGTRWLIDAVQCERHRVAWPIGFYFAKLWYYERLYPLVYTTAALGRVMQRDELLR